MITSNGSFIHLKIFHVVFLPQALRRTGSGPRALTTLIIWTLINCKTLITPWCWAPLIHVFTKILAYNTWRSMWAHIRDIQIQNNDLVLIGWSGLVWLEWCDSSGGLNDIIISSSIWIILFLFPSKVGRSRVHRKLKKVDVRFWSNVKPALNGEPLFSSETLVKKSILHVSTHLLALFLPVSGAVFDYSEYHRDHAHKSANKSLKSRSDIVFQSWLLQVHECLWH